MAPADAPTSEWIGGVHAVTEALRSDPGSILEVWVADGLGAKGRRAVENAARAARVKLRQESRARLDERVPDAAHQGVIARVGEVEYAAFEAVLAAAPPVVVLLDGVEDPRNLGAILRSAWAFDVGAVLIPKHRAAGLTPAAVKTAAGAVAHVAVARVGNASRALEALKEAGYWIYGADGVSETDHGSLGISPPAVLVLGAEGKGIRPAVRKACDAMFRIPMAEGVDSLNVAVAAGIVLGRIYEGRIGMAASKGE